MLEITSVSFKMKMWGGMNQRSTVAAWSSPGRLIKNSIYHCLWILMSWDFLALLDYSCLLLCSLPLQAPVLCLVKLELMQCFVLLSALFVFYVGKCFFLCTLVALLLPDIFCCPCFPCSFQMIFASGSEVKQDFGPRIPLSCFVSVIIAICICSPQFYFVIIVFYCLHIVTAQLVPLCYLPLILVLWTLRFRITCFALCLVFLINRTIKCLFFFTHSYLLYIIEFCFFFKLLVTFKKRKR